MVLRKPTYGRARLVAFKPRACLRRVPVDYWSYDHTYCTVSYPFRSDVRNQINAIVTMRRVARRQATSSDTVHHPLQSARAQRTLFLRTPSFPMELGPDFAFSWGLSNISRSTIATYTLLSDPATSENANETFAKMRRRLFEVLTVPVPDLQDKSSPPSTRPWISCPRDERYSCSSQRVCRSTQGEGWLQTFCPETSSFQILTLVCPDTSPAQDVQHLQTIFCFCHTGCFQAQLVCV